MFEWYLIISVALSKEAMRFQYTYEQGFDTSCGIAVTATLLNTYWGLNVSEKELIEKFITPKIEKKDYSVTMADIAGIVKFYNLASKAYAMNLTQLRDAIKKGFAPIIIHYEKPVKHFVLLLGFDNDWIIIADPARGLEAISEATFMERYSGNVLLVASNSKKVQLEKLGNAINTASTRADLLELVATW